jgi:FKBP-type peptidyl-prolyl cis-trans isomerase FklB
MTRWMLVVGLVLSCGVASAQPAQDAPGLKTDKERLSYALGMDLGAQLKSRGVDIDPAVFTRALQDALAGGKTLLTDEQARSVIAELQKSQMLKQAATAKAVGDKNRAEGEAFLAANKTKAGVVTLPSGLQYKVITNGTGPKPTADQTVVCQYKGTLLNGKEFDSSYKHGEPATFPVNRVIKGWTEVLQLMPVGSKWQVFIPANLAYGERGAGVDIGPDATLVFEIELVAIK